METPGACNSDGAEMSKTDDLSNVAAMAEAMGMSQECETDAMDYVKNEHSTSKASFGFGGIGPGLGVFGGGGNSASQSNAQTAIDAMKTKGCGEFLAVSNNVLNKSMRIMCKLDSVSQTSTNISRGRASIEIEALRGDDGAAERRYIYENADKYTPEMFDRLIASVPTATGGDVTMRNSTATARVTSDLKVIGELDITTKEEIKQEMTDMTSQFVEHEVSKHLTNTEGEAENTRSIVESLSQNIATDVDVTSEEVLQDAVTKQSGSSSIVIRAVGGNVDLDNVVLEADTNLKMITENILRKCNESAKSIVRKRVAELATKSKTELEMSGRDMVALLDAIGKNNVDMSRTEAEGFAAQIKATGAAISKALSGIMIGALLPLIAIGLVLKFVADPRLKAAIVGAIVLLVVWYHFRRILIIAAVGSVIAALVAFVVMRHRRKTKVAP